MIVITGEIKSIEQDCREIEPIIDDKDVQWKQFVAGDCIVIKGSNLKAISELPRTKSLGERVFEETGCLP